MSAIQLALIGAGAIGRTHIDRIQRHPQLALSAIADPSAAGKTLAQDLNIPWFASHQDLLERTEPQGVIVATPNATHVSVACDCLARGIPVLVEKPIASTVAEAQELVDASARQNTPALIGHHRRHNPILHRAKEIIQSGQLGQIVSATALATFRKPDGYFDVAWRRQPGGGPVLINLIHDIDMLRFLLGEIESVQALDSHAARGMDVEDTAAALLRFTSGALGTVIVSDAATAPWCWDFCAGEQDQYPRQQVQSHFITGTHGSLSLPDLTLWHYPGERHWHAEMTRSQTMVHLADPYTRQLEHFAAMITDQAAPLCSALDGLRTLQATLAIHEAAQTKQAVSCIAILNN
ncbi:Gfo/Idh/MocA family oxidoreductase [Alcaligenaceae bacterium CGII-47]|nr:Gfo/Idh/MocA family oxidoreductase [Alcaligenaceae bacterium CGII-47]